MGHSRRAFFEDMLSTFGESVSRGQFKLRFLDIGASNLCNLTCVMCNARLSTSWIAKEKKLSQAGFNFERPSHEQNRAWKLSGHAIQNLFADPEIFQSLFYLSLKGGEPFLEPSNEILLERLVSIVPPGQLVLDVTTNGTVVSPALLQKIDHFRAVKLLFSVEGLGKTYSLMRGGNRFTFAQFEANLRLLAQKTNVEIFVVFLLTALNLSELRPMLQWYRGLNLPNVRLNFKNILVNPYYLSLNALPTDIKSAELLELRKEGWHDFKDTPEIMGLSNVCQALATEHPRGALGQRDDFARLQEFMSLYVGPASL